MHCQKKNWACVFVNGNNKLLGTTVRFVFRLGSPLFVFTLPNPTCFYAEVSVSGFFPVHNKKDNDNWHGLNKSVGERVHLSQLLSS